MIRRFDANILVEATIPRSVGRSALTPEMAQDTPAQRGYREGYTEGFTAGQSEGVRDAEQRMRSIEAEAVDRILAERAALAAEREHIAAVVGGIHGALERHASTVLMLSTEIALMAVTRMLSQLDAERALMGKLCAALLSEHQDAAKEMLVSTEDAADLPAEIAGIVLTTDAGLRSGSFRLRTTRGDVETNIVQRLDAIRAAFLDALRKRHV